MNSKKNRKIFLEELPMRGKYIDWENSIDKIIRFIYDDVKGFVKIINYNKDGYKLNIVYECKEYEITTGTFSKCQLGCIIGERTKDFKIEIGTRFQDDKRDITIIKRKKEIDNKGIERKYYKYYCNLCTFSGWKYYSIIDKEFKDELWIEESNLQHHEKGCACCCNPSQIIVEGINDIPTTAPWMIPYFQGGYKEANLYTHSSNKSINAICPDCKRIKSKQIRIQDIYIKHSIGCSCSDSIPYSEKFNFSVLEQLGINFQTQLTKTTFDWCDKYKYDFYIPELNIIIETHGLQHYKDCTGNWNTKLKEQQKIDKLKKELALNNGIKEENYIVIDCRKSELEWIKNNENGIFNSRLNELFNLSKIDWSKCEEFTCSNLVKVACEYKRDNPDMTTTEIGQLMGYNFNTICSWLKKGNLIGWCYYNAKEETEKALGRPVEIFKNEISLGIFKSTMDLERQSEKLFGVKLLNANIGKVCRGISKHHHGFKFKYTSDLIQ